MTSDEGTGLTIPGEKAADEKVATGDSAEARINPLRVEKKRKLDELRALGVNPYPYKFVRNESVQSVREKFDAKLQNGEKVEETKVRLAGRLMTLRAMGKASFFNIEDQTGSIQIYFRNQELTELESKIFNLVDIGDIVGIEGFPFRTQRGELSIHCQKFEMLTKTLEPLPEKYHGIADVEVKYRERHLDLLSDPASRKVFETRSRIFVEIRRWMTEQNFLEVETPILQPMYGGAAAHPFETHHRALDMKLYLKISPELYLKRLIVGGFEKVFEITKNFRNEGIDRTHNPEFTMMEWYEAYTDYFDQMSRFETLVSEVAKKITGSYEISYQGQLINLKPPWKRLSVFDAVAEKTGLDLHSAGSAELIAALKKAGSDRVHAYALDGSHDRHQESAGKIQVSAGEMIMELFELLCEKELIQPTFVMDHPVEISPLTKIHRSDPRCVERFEPFIAGMEIGNSYSELNDPEEQLRRLKDQEAKRSSNEEAHPMDEDFLRAIDVGMPPTGGVGIGIERLVMLLTDQSSIRDILFFPTMKPRL